MVKKTTAPTIDQWLSSQVSYPARGVRNTQGIFGRHTNRGVIVAFSGLV